MQEHQPDVPLNEVALAQDAVQAVRVLLDLKLTGNQRLILSKLEREQGNMTRTVMALSQELDMSEPTVRRTLQLCRSLGLISCGDRESKGKSVRLTPLGQTILDLGTNGGGAEKQPPDKF